jgi:hypothetical protein
MGICMFKRVRLLLTFILFVSSTTTFAKKNCYSGYLASLEDRMRAGMNEGKLLNFWSETYENKQLIGHMESISSKEREKFFATLKTFVDKSGDSAKDAIFNQNVTKLMNEMMKSRLMTRSQIRTIWGDFSTTRSRFLMSRNSNDIYYQPFVDAKKTSKLEQILNSSKLSKTYREEYRRIIEGSNLTADDLAHAMKYGFKLSGNSKDMARFREYIKFLNMAKPSTRRKGMQYVKNIYNYDYVHNNLAPTMFMRVDKKFLNEMSRAANVEKKHYKEVLRKLKMEENTKVRQELEDIARREAKGLRIDEARRARLVKQLDSTEISPKLQKEARRLAQGKARVYKNLLSNCFHGNNSKTLKSAKKKFARFKLALAMGSTPYFYLQANKDRKDTDPFFWERLGYEMSMSLIFTMLGNKIMTNTNTSFFRKYWEGQWKFTAMSLPVNVGYDKLFEGHAYFKYIKQLYSDVPIVSPQDQRAQEMRERSRDPKFREEYVELLNYVEKMSKEKNLKFYLNKYFNLNKQYSHQDALKLTQEDLLSNEGQEFLLDLVAEEMYYREMGEWAIMQSGNKGMDLYIFSRFYSAPINGIWATAFGIAQLQLLCVQPFGKVGTMAAIIGMTLGEKWVTGKFWYNQRAQAVNR